MQNMHTPKYVSVTKRMKFYQHSGNWKTTCEAKFQVQKEPLKKKKSHRRECDGDYYRLGRVGWEKPWVTGAEAQADEGWVLAFRSTAR